MYWTITKAAKEWGIHNATLSKRLAEHGISVERGKEYHTREITRAVVGSLQAERIRDVAVSADLKELQVKEITKELIRMDDAKALFSDTLMQVRQLFVSVPAQLSNRCNPNDPAFARAALEVWREHALKVVDRYLKKKK